MSLQESVLKLLSTQELGSATVIHPRVAVACKHEIKKETPPFFVMKNGHEVRVKEYAAHPKLDLVVLLLNKALTSVVPIQIEKPRNDCTISIAGYPKYADYNFIETPGRLINFGSKSMEFYITEYSSNAWMNGASGGAIVDDTKRLIGILHSSTDPEFSGYDRGWGVPICAIGAFIRTLPFGDFYPDE